MAKATLEFDLNDSGDYEMHKRILKSDDMAGALWEITHNTKKNLEWSLEDKDLNKYEVLDLVYDKIFEILQDHNIYIDELYS